MKLNVDFSLKFIPDTARIWAMHPGKGQIFLESFLQDNCIFLGLSRTTVTPEMVATTEALRQQTNMALAWNDFYDEATLDASQKTLAPPSPDYTTYPESSADKGVSAQFGNLVRFFREMKPQDLVLVPSEGGTYGSFVVGEIAEGPWVTKSGFDSNGVEYIIQVRPISWLHRRYPRRGISKDLSGQLSNRQSITKIDRSLFGPEVYDLTYSSYVSNIDSKSEIRGPAYQSNPLDLVYPAQLIAFLVAVYHAVDNGASADLKDRSIDYIIDKYYQADLVEHLAIKFESSGWFRAKAKDAALILFISAGIAVLPNYVPQLAANLEVRFMHDGQAVPNSPEAAKALTAIEGLLNAVSPKTLDIAKSKAESSQKKIGMNSDVTVRLAP